MPDVPLSASRETAIGEFLRTAGYGGLPVRKLAADASFRRYFRITARDGDVILMDAPPPQENPRAYVAIATALRGFGLSAPEIYAADLERGFLLIEDFGDNNYNRLLAAGADEAALYELAVDALIALQKAAAEQGVPAVPPYDEARLLTEVSLLVDWYAPEVLGAALPEEARAEYVATWRAVLNGAAADPTTLVLRDFHIDNLMLLPERAGVRACGLLDFQDALAGPPGYDLVSLLEDARRDVPPALRTAMIDRYLAAFPNFDRRAFARAAAILAAQRNAKIIGLFVRLWRRDGKPGYLVHIPRVWRLLQEDLRREPALQPVAGWLDRWLPPGTRERPLSTAA